MPVNPNFGILQPVDVGDEIQRGYRNGRQVHAQNALSQFAQNPDSPEALNNLAKFAPRQALQIRERQAAKQAEAERTTAIGDALTGQADLNTLAYIDPSMFNSMNKQQREEAAASLDTVGQLALLADTPQKWDAIVGQLAQRDPSFQQYVGQFAAREAIIAQTGQAKELLTQQAPSVGFIPDGATGFAKNAAGEQVLQALQQSGNIPPPPPGFELDQGGPASAPDNFPR